MKEKENELGKRQFGVWRRTSRWVDITTCKGMQRKNRYQVTCKCITKVSTELPLNTGKLSVAEQDRKEQGTSPPTSLTMSFVDKNKDMDIL